MSETGTNTEGQAGIFAFFADLGAFEEAISKRISSDNAKQPTLGTVVEETSTPDVNIPPKTEDEEDSGRRVKSRMSDFL